MAAADSDRAPAEVLVALAVTPPGHPVVMTSDRLMATPAGTMVETAGERLARLEAKVAAVGRATRAPATLRAYRSDCAQFERWCADHGLDVLPAAPSTVAAYLVDLADPEGIQPSRRVSTLNRRLAAIGEAHRLAGHPSPTTATTVRETMKGLRRLLGVAPTQKRGVSVDDVRAAVAEIGL